MIMITYINTYKHSKVHIKILNIRQIVIIVNFDL